MGPNPIGLMALRRKAMEGLMEKVVACKPGRELSSGTELTGLGLPASRIVGK